MKEQDCSKSVEKHYKSAPTEVFRVISQTSAVDSDSVRLLRGASLCVWEGYKGLDKVE